uniref:Uncharacterized protein n=1 Tax=Picea sitchensis TaxID=3332 RepID=A0A6B9XSW9_PICSI|nr:hypothetical protein Q903MT_gene4116 [Picea sitchensis]
MPQPLASGRNICGYGTLNKTRNPFTQLPISLYLRYDLLLPPSWFFLLELLPHQT